MGALYKGTQVQGPGDTRHVGGVTKVWCALLMRVERERRVSCTPSEPPPPPPEHEGSRVDTAVVDPVFICLQRLIRMMAGGDLDGEGAARRRRERHLRSWLRHERQSVAMALAEFKHHSSRGQRMARARGERDELTYAMCQMTPPPLPPSPPPPTAASTVYFRMDVDGDMLAARVRPPTLAESRTQVRVLRHTVEQIGDVAPLVPALAVPVPQMVDQLVAVLTYVGSFVPEQVAAHSLSRKWMSTSSFRLVTFQMAQVVLLALEVTMVFSKDRVPLRLPSRPLTFQFPVVFVVLFKVFLPVMVRDSALWSKTSTFLVPGAHGVPRRQNVDIPVPRKRSRDGFQGFSPGQSSTQRYVEQNVDLPVLGPRPSRGFRPRQGSQRTVEQIIGFSCVSHA